MRVCSVAVFLIIFSGCSSQKLMVVERDHPLFAQDHPLAMWKGPEVFRTTQQEEVMAGKPGNPQLRQHQH